MKTATVGKHKSAPVKKHGEKVFPVVAIGASAGGLEAISALLKELPGDTGMAFIYVQHLSPDHKSYLTSILSRITKMKVQEIENMEHIEPNNVYVIPHNSEIKVVNGHIQLLHRLKNTSNLSIDILFSSLADTHKSNVIGIILSGNASDGTIGIKAVKDAGGLTFAQDASAQVSSMPQSAIASGAVDFILSPKEIAKELVRMSVPGYVRIARKLKSADARIPDNDPALKAILSLLQKDTGIDFSHYKMSTIKRRLNHKMLQYGVKTIQEYAKLLVKKDSEVKILYQDLLINVTSFFRDPEAFKYLRTTFLPKLLKSKKAEEVLRIWVPACSTGEEAFSLAMIITELQEKKVHKVPVQIFATDLSEQAIHDARMGEYTEADVRLIPKKMLQRFFTKSGHNFRIVKEIREMCLFAPHNILLDPPFSRMDLISCCNLLIYFDNAAQKKAFATMHFALNENGYLMLGKSETVGVASQLFSQVNNKFRIYSRKKNMGNKRAPALAVRFPRANPITQKIVTPARTAPANLTGIDAAIDAVLLSRYMPACAVIDKDMEILQFRGTTNLYLRHGSGKASLNILKMIRPEFAVELRNAIHQVMKTKLTVKKQGIDIKTETGMQTVAVEVSLLKNEWDEMLLMIVFTMTKKKEHAGALARSAKGSAATKQNLQIKSLTEELETIRGEMHSLIESQETANEELQSANEEIVSANEEFQTLNEELETSKEEIEATNEELISTNQELKRQNELLEESYNYSQTIIATIHEPMVILDRNFNVKSANSSFYRKFLLSKEETEGQPFFEMADKQWDIPRLREMLDSILAKNTHFANFEVTHTFNGIGEKVMLLNANRIVQKTHREKLILLAMEDITERYTRDMNEKEHLEKDIIVHQADKAELENIVHRRNRQLELKNLELEGVNKDLVSFTYISSHDLQEPLRKIQTFVSFMLEQEKESLSVSGKRYLEKTQDTAKQMRALIEDLLVYSGTKNSERQFEKTDLSVLMEEVKKSLSELIMEKKVKITMTGGCDPVIIRFQFRQLLQNLVSNSIKFSRPGIEPRIVVKTRIATGAKLKLAHLEPGSHYCHISLSDNGIGFEPQYNQRIFEVFQRLNSHDAYKGTGMGLAICRRIVENHNGIIMASGTLDKGARFDIYVPAG